MKKVIGITRLQTLVPSIKTALLYYEHIHVHKLFENLGKERKDIRKSTYLDIEYLIGKEIISELPTFHKLGLDSLAFLDLQNLEVTFIKKLLAWGDKWAKVPVSEIKRWNRRDLASSLKLANAFADGAILAGDHLLRLAANGLEKSSGDIIAIPMISDIQSFKNHKLKREEEVLRLILNALPVPDELTPLEQILDFRSNPESKERFLALRNWQIEATHSNYSPRELSERLEFLINEYMAHMKLHNIKYRTSKLETILTAPLELLENVLKIKWSETAKQFFCIRKSKIALLEAELKAPGKELAYIVRAKEVFE